MAEAGPADVDAAVAAARHAYDSVWGRMPGRERAKYLFRIARAIQERARELAVLESLDNGKPIRESRDVDVPLAAAHFFYYAGWADKLEHAGFGPSPRPLGVAGPDHPLELPAADGGVEDRARARDRQHRRAQAGRDDAADGADARRDHRRGRPAAGRRQHHRRRARDRRRRSSSTRDVDKIAFTGSTEVGKEIQRSVAGTSKRLSLELGGKAANIVFDDAPLDQAVEGIVNGIFFNQGHVCCAGSRLLVQESVADEVIAALQARMATLRARRPAGQEHRHRRDQLGRPARADPRAERRGRGRGRGALVAALRAARRAASGSRRRSSRASPRRIASRATRSSARCSRY